jgi:hypothetical protein
MKKLKYEFVKDFFESQNCVLLETGYLGALQKMKYICQCGKESVISWSAFSKGDVCIAEI